MFLNHSAVENGVRSNFFGELLGRLIHFVTHKSFGMTNAHAKQRLAIFHIPINSTFASRKNKHLREQEAMSNELCITGCV